MEAKVKGIQYISKPSTACPKHATSFLVLVL
ncbi:hypothetical protein CCACVL1_28347 [Corchorus capsularis]|uniref:Uncharacterized protein n=1 Tax=Corchorus capsularis TaxID=210143 RepID=A0A1R3G6S8_COCAP|nr:hypothetical protein CCACVL1_28347 [Corchorus capsularis]